MNKDSKSKKYGAVLFAEGIVNKESLLGYKWILPCNDEKQMKLNLCNESIKNDGCFFANAMITKLVSIY